MSLNTLKEMQALVEAGYATVKENANLLTFKYHRNVQFQNLWNKIPGIKECRGHTYDKETGETVLVPPPKVFNYLENSTWDKVDENTKVIVCQKFNGFLASAAIHHDGELVVGTTGTTNSAYAKLAKKMISEDPFAMNLLSNDVTWAFEIIHDSDPHIVNEGRNRCIPLLPRRHNWDGSISLSKENRQEMTFKQAKELVAKNRSEGFMVYDHAAYLHGEPVPAVCKLKTPYYIQKKRLMRMSKSQVESMYSSGLKLNQILENFDESFRECIIGIVTLVDKQVWLDYTDQQRRKVIESFVGV